MIAAWGTLAIFLPSLFLSFDYIRREWIGAEGRSCQHTRKRGAMPRPGAFVAFLASVFIRPFARMLRMWRQQKQRTLDLSYKPLHLVGEP
jgi:hypothetical protein